jgi:hypothetical protein
MNAVSLGKADDVGFAIAGTVSWVQLLSLQVYSDKK